MSTTLTCVYCGHPYPEGTPPHGSKVLTNHIMVCEKHPMSKLRRALVKFVGVDGEKDLNAMEVNIRLMPIMSEDMVIILEAIQALRETLPT